MASNTAVKKVVTVIPVKPVEVVKGLALGAKKRVAAYCRVSTDLKEQETSFESQVQHYTDTIGKRTDWDLIDIYADDGISGTTTTKRTEFLRMINDCMAGKIDMIITKSISRFARNTEDCLHFVRKLKDKGIAVYFETENIDTLGSGGELLLTILSGMAQDSSRNQSDVTKWGILRQFESGRVLVNTTRFLGYDKNEDGELVINEEQADLVRRVFREYLEGKSYNSIAKGLTKDKIKTITGKEKWWDSTISGMLENEKYYGAALLQKTDPEVYNEEYKSISGELEEVRKKRLEIDKDIESKDGLKQRFDEILEAINSRDSLLEEFDEEIFNALVEKIEILTPMHFVFEHEIGGLAK